MAKVEHIVLSTSRLPARLEDAIDSFYQTWKFARLNGIKMNRDLVMQQVKQAAARFNYTVSTTKKAGELILERPTQRVFVDPDTFPTVSVEPR